MRRLQLLYLALGASTAILNPFLIVIASEHGLGTESIGVMAAMGAAGIFAAGPVWGHLGDYVIGRRKALLAANLIASAMAMAIAAPISGLVLALIVPIYVLAQGSCIGLCDSLAVAAIENPHRDYGRIRMMASVGFGVFSIPAGFLYNATGYAIGGPLFVASVGVIALVLVFVPDHRPIRGHSSGRASAAESPAIRQASRFGSTGLAFQLQPRLPGILAASFLAWFAVNISFTLLSLHIVDLGGSASDVALSFGVSALAEVPGMLIAARVAARLGLRGLFAIGTLGFAATFVSWMVLDTPAQIIVSRILTGVCYGGMSVAMVLTITEILPGGLQATGQTLYQATAAGLAAIAGNSIGGLLYGAAGAPTLFAVCAAMATAGAILGFVTLPVKVRRATVPAELEDVVLPNSPVV